MHRPSPRRKTTATSAVSSVRREQQGPARCRAFRLCAGGRELASALHFAQHQLERGFAGAAGFRHGLEIDLRVLDRRGAAGAVDFPAPGLGRVRAVFHDNGEVFMVNHRGNIAAESAP